jgi:hypothetical protein
MNPTIDILIVSFAGHFPWLRYALKSIEKFATGFRQVKVLIPSEDLAAMNPILSEFSEHKGIPIRVQCFQDWPGKGFLRHEHVIMCSDEFTDADFVCHIDSDCMFTEPVTPDDYFVNGKPVLVHASFHWLVTEQQANLGMWQVAVERAVGWITTEETMRRHPAVHYRKTYQKARECIEAHTMKPCADYIWACENSFPQSFAEFPTLGAVAWKFFHEDYHWLNQEKGEWPHGKLTQFWSHSPPEIAQKPVVNDKPLECTPESLLKML